MPPVRMAFLASLLVASTATAAPVFPDDGTIGLEPPPGMVAKGSRFVRGGATLAVRHMVKDAFRRSLDREVAVAVGGPEARVDPFPVGAYPGVVIRGRTTLEGVDYRIWHVSAGAPDETAAVDAMVPVGDTEITDAQIEAALRTIVVRPPGLAARLVALREQPVVAAALHFFTVAAICGVFIAIGAALCGPEAVARGRRWRPASRRHLSGRATSHGKR